MNNNSYALMDKLRTLYEQGKYDLCVSEVIHYLEELNGLPDSPLVHDLVRFFKKVVIMDLDHLDRNLNQVDKFFLESEIRHSMDFVDMLSRLTSIKSLRSMLFDRYYTVLLNLFSRSHQDVKLKLIALLVDLSRDDLDHRVQVVENFLDQYQVHDAKVLSQVNHALTEILDEDPDLGVFFKDHVESIIERYFFNENPRCMDSFISLFTYLQGFRNFFIKKGIAMMQSPHMRAKEKSLKIFSVMVGNRFSKQGFEVLLENIKGKNLHFQSNVVEVLSSIVQNNVKYYLSKILKRYYMGGMTNQAKLGFVELLGAIAETDFSLVFRKIMARVELDDDDSFQLSLIVLKNLDFEFPNQFDANFFSEFKEFHRYHWKTKINLLERLWRIIQALDRTILVIWFGRLLQRILMESEWGEREVIETSRQLFSTLQEHEPRLMEKLVALNDKITYIKKNFTAAKNFPRMLREHVDYELEQENLERASKLLLAEYSSFVEKIAYFDNFINTIEFKHLILDLVEDWYIEKEYIIEDLNVVREYLEELIKAKSAEQESNLDELISRLQKKMDIHLVQYDELAIDSVDLDAGEVARISPMFLKVSSFNTNFSLLEMEITSVLFHHSNVMKEHADFLNAWSSFQSRVGKKMRKFNLKVKSWLDKMENSKAGDDKKPLKARLLQNLFSEYVRQSISDYRKILKKIEKETRFIEKNLYTREIDELEKRITYSKSKYMDFIERRTGTIKQYWQGLHRLSTDIEFIMGLRKLFDEWHVTKDNITNKVSNYYASSMELIDVAKIKRMINIVSPIPLESLKGQLNSVKASKDIEYIESVLQLIQKYNIKAHVRNKALYSMETNTGISTLASPVKIKTKVDASADSILLKLFVKNSTIQEIYDFTASIRVPDRFKIVNNPGNRHREAIPILPAGKNLMITWKLAREDSNQNPLLSPSPDASNISIFFSGNVAGEQPFHKIKHIDVIYEIPSKST
ncbi:hypothetical protein GF325_17140 [Candidatus Bathyarchaeota archaeon]|nr:hypothetical protein [Candidatus Bathyarchaeota archaeon]